MHAPSIEQTLSPARNGFMLEETKALLTQLARERSLRIEAEKEAGKLRRQIHSRSRTSSIVSQAIRDSNHLLLANIQGEYTGCLYMQRTYGMSRRRWEWAVSFLRLAKIVAPHASLEGLAFRTLDFDHAILLHQNMALELAETTDALTHLRAYLPPCRRKSP